MKFFPFIKRISLIFVFILTACTLPTPVATQESPTASAAAPQLAGTSWALVTYGSSDAENTLISGSQITLQFDSQGHIAGNAGCNSFGGSYQENNGSLQFSQVIATLMACEADGVMQQEHDFLDALNQAATFEISNGNLQIRDTVNQYMLNFVPLSAADATSTTTPVVITATDNPTATATIEPTATIVSSGSTQPDYLDDRSTATGLMQSYFNAINRHEYLRAYSYWRDPAGSNGPFEDFQAGYATTTHVEISFGQIGGDAGAGQMYYSVPALLTAQTSDDNTQVYAACYILHLSQPTFQEPPFQGLTIERGKASALASGADGSAALAAACSGGDYPVGNPINPAPVTDTSDISKDNYLDDRSDAVLVLSSYFNAINLQEYARAYGYWDASDLPPYTDFKDGYANTLSVTFAAGDVFADAGAGNRYYSVPVVIRSQLDDGTQQTFAGCYVLHMSVAAIQASPPFRPLAIRSANIAEVANTGDMMQSMPDSCQQ